MTISSLVVDTLPGQTKEAAAALAALEGVEVHEQYDTKLVVTIESANVDTSHAMANSFHEIPGVVMVSLVYVNLEDQEDLQ